MNKEEKWFRRLKRCIDDMPNGVIVIVHNGTIQLCHESDREEYFETIGDIQNVPEIDSFLSRNVIPCGESI